MTGPQLVLPARGMVAASIVLLPSNARERYREEFRTELAELGFGQQMAQAGSLLVGAFALRRALQDRETALEEATPKSLLCRLGRHRYVRRNDDNPERRGRPYLRCIRCGNRFDPPEPEKFDVEAYKRRTSFFAS
ncbi:MAG: hypothetical protein ABWZ98_14395 [Nakamurella sp.]